MTVEFEDALAAAYILEHAIEHLAGNLAALMSWDEIAANFAARKLLVRSGMAVLDEIEAGAN